MMEAHFGDVILQSLKLNDYDDEQHDSVDSI
jgi:hypothetical protein